MTHRLHALRLLFACTLLAVFGSPGQALGQRTRVLIDDGWRFTKGDPPGVDPATLLYDVRPTTGAQDQQERAAEATSAAAALAKADRPVLKPWILPTGNPFLRDPAKRFVRPPGNPGGDVPYVQAAFDDHMWQAVTLPHDWAIVGPFNAEHVGGGMGRLPSPGVGWYRRRLAIPLSSKGQSIYLQVDGAMSYAEVWLNGKLVGGWPYGYASWQLDLTPYAVPGGTNQLAIRLDNPPDFSRWYPGAGLYRNVWLLTTNPVHVAQWGTRVTTPRVSADAATVDLAVEVQNNTSSPGDVTISSKVYPLSTSDVRGPEPVLSFPAQMVSVPAGSSRTVRDAQQINHPQLWGPPPQQRPNRYVAITTVREAGRVVDTFETPFGIRQVEARPDGLYVNGQRIRIQGVNQHHDLGPLGSAFNKRAAERQLQELRAVGCNAIRMAHNPPAPELLAMTDRMGFLVFAEIFDAWARQKTPYDFHLIFPDWHEQDLRAFIRRDRNHPSIFIWSVGNEVGEQHTGEAGAAVARELVAIAHDEDATRPATASMNSAKPGSPFADALDVMSLNYQGEGIRNTPDFADFKGLKTPPQYQPFHDRYPDKLVISSESAAALSSRGVYLFPVAKGISNPVRDGSGGDSATHQVSAYEIYANDFGSSADKVFAAQDHHPFVGGEFVWSGWDYLGEPQPYYSSRSSYVGIIDLAGLPKDRFYLYQSRWRPDLPMAHILPHWTWPERVGQVTPVHVFTSGDEAELFLNGRSLGRKKKGPYEYRLRWDDVVYEPGTLKVVAYRDGKPWATDEVTTAGKPARLLLAADRDRLKADGTDLAFVTLQVADGNGVAQPRAANHIRFTLEGPGDIVGTANGDPTDMHALPSAERDAFSGKCVVVVRTRPGGRGTLRLHAESPGLAAAEISLAAQ